MRLSTRFKAHLDRLAPNMTAVLRRLRDEYALTRRVPRRTPHGYSIVGPESMQNGTFETAEVDLVTRLLPESDVFVDVGANVGYYVGLARQGGKTVIAVEPLQSNLHLLYRMLEINGWNDVEVWPVALGDRIGIVDLYGSGTGASLIEGWAGASSAYSRRVPMTRLDLLLRDRFEGQRLIIKIDVEGAEAAVLAGAQKTLHLRPRPVWLVECTLDLHHPNGNAHFEEVFQTFWRAGYAAATADAERRLVKPGDLARWLQQRRIEFGSHNWLFVEARGAADGVVTTAEGVNVPAP